MANVAFSGSLRGPTGAFTTLSVSGNTATANVAFSGSLRGPTGAFTTLSVSGNTSMANVSISGTLSAGALWQGDVITLPTTDNNVDITWKGSAMKFLVSQASCGSDFNIYLSLDTGVSGAYVDCYGKTYGNNGNVTVNWATGLVYLYNTTSTSIPASNYIDVWFDIMRDSSTKWMIRGTGYRDPDDYFFMLHGYCTTTSGNTISTISLMASSNFDSGTIMYSYS